MELHFSCEGERSGPEDPTSLPTSQEVWGLSPPVDGKFPPFQSQKKDLKNMVMRQLSGVRLWGQWLEKWAREARVRCL